MAPYIHTQNYATSSAEAFFVLVLICHGNIDSPRIALRGPFQEMPGRGKLLMSQPREQDWGRYNGVRARILAGLWDCLSYGPVHCLCCWLQAECGQTQTRWLTAASGVGRCPWKQTLLKCQFHKRVALWGNLFETIHIFWKHPRITRFNIALNPYNITITEKNNCKKKKRVFFLKLILKHICLLNSMVTCINFFVFTLSNFLFVILEFMWSVSHRDQGPRLFNFFHAQLRWAWNFNYS